MSLYIWQYYLIVPNAAVAVADSVAPALSNPDGIEATFQRFPGANEEGEYLELATHWAAEFLATDLMSQGNPSREALESYLVQNLALESLLWVRCKNPYHPDTPENARGIVVASNWAAFPVGAVVGWPAIWEALGNG